MQFSILPQSRSLCLLLFIKNPFGLRCSCSVPSPVNTRLNHIINRIRQAMQSIVPAQTDLFELAALSPL